MEAVEYFLKSHFKMLFILGIYFEKRIVSGVEKWQHCLEGKLCTAAEIYLRFIKFRIS